ncbi:MAG TPA: MBL fold metallo-hydrolase [Candidatus Limnocylindrales bacterium]|jgi:phosphoribosyl 1,2-cyclic phosphodiesterase|nr:MBL fold metallo-hydrolase [Candidatus Limnocylindrales bacterium]
MKVVMWGTRGSLATPGRDTARYGGNTSCVEVIGEAGARLILDAGTGIRALGMALPPGLRRVDVLLTHLHMDHIQGLGFFGPLFNPAMEVHIWGPASATLSLRTRLMRYLSAPLFPVPLRDLPCNLELHEVPCASARIGEFEIATNLICHPGPTVGYRITGRQGVIAYMSDHEPALGQNCLRLPAEWTSGQLLAEEADLLIHDAQYTDEEYTARVGWGHSSIAHALQFAALARTKHLVAFHHDPAHDDTTLDRLMAVAIAQAAPPFAVTAAAEGAVFELAR